MLTQATVVINRPPAEVLAVIADFAAYPAWAASVRRCEVQTIEADRPATVDFEVDSGAFRDAYTLRYDWRQIDPERATGVLSWSLVRADQLLTALTGSYQLDGPADGPTTVTYQLAVELKVPMLGLLKRKAEKTVIATALADLKSQVEG